MKKGRSQFELRPKLGWLKGCGGSRARSRRYARVRCEIDADGSLTPVAVLWRSGRAFEITKVGRRESRPCLGTGRRTRFTVWFGGYQTYLWWDTNRWHVMSPPPFISSMQKDRRAVGSLNV